MTATARFLIIFWTALGVVAAHPVSIQASSKKDIRIGTKVRIVHSLSRTGDSLSIARKTPHAPMVVIGSVVSVTSDSITLHTDIRGNALYSTRLNDEMKLYVVERKKRSILKGAAIGAACGSGIAFFVGLAAIYGDDALDTTSVPSPRKLPLKSMAAYVSVGAAVGSVIGYLYHEDVWREVDKENWPSALSLRVDPSDRTVRLCYRF